MAHPIDALPPLPAPLRADADGVMRIGATRVTLDSVVLAFMNGSTPEEIVAKYPTVELGDIYAVIAHYLANRETVDAYLAARAAEGEATRAEIERRKGDTSLRDRLLARRRLAS